MNPWMIVRIFGIVVAIGGMVFRERELSERKKFRKLKEEELELKKEQNDKF